jgi:hypothetical protein
MCECFRNKFLFYFWFSSIHVLCVPLKINKNYVINSNKNVLYLFISRLSVRKGHVALTLPVEINDFSFHFISTLGRIYVETSNLQNSSFPLSPFKQGIICYQ